MSENDTKSVFEKNNNRTINIQMFDQCLCIEMQ